MADTTPKETADRVADQRKARPRQAVAKDLTSVGRLQIEYVPIESVVPSTYNPNRQQNEEFELLVLSMKEDGFTLPILIGADNVIIDGEHRWLAAHTLGYDEIPVVRVEMAEMQRKISTIRHNTARGHHDATLEAEIFRGFKDVGRLDFLANSLDMTEDALDELISDLAPPEPLAPGGFSGVWVPATMPAEDAELIELSPTERGEDRAPVLKADTAAAVAYHERQRQRLDALTDEGDRRRLRAHLRKARHHIKLRFTGNDAEVVEEALGDAPAEKLLDMCIADLGPEGVEAVLWHFMQDHKWESYAEYLEFQKRYNDDRYGVTLPVLEERKLKIWETS